MLRGCNLREREENMEVWVCVCVDASDIYTPRTTILSLQSGAILLGPETLKDRLRGDDVAVRLWG